MGYLYLFSIVFLFTTTGFSQTSSGAIDQLIMQGIQQQTQGQGCLNNMMEQVDAGITSQYEVATQANTNLINMSEKFFEHGKNCRNELAQAKIQYEDAKLKHQLQLNEFKVKMRREEIAYQKALNDVDRQCRDTAAEDFRQVRAWLSSGVVGEEQGGPQALFGRTENINKYEPLFYQDCMAHPNTIRDVQLLGDEMKANIEALNANLKSSADSLANITRNLEFAQEQTTRNCLEGQEQLEYQQAVLEHSNAMAASMIQKQNSMGLLGAGYTCLSGIFPPTTGGDDSTGRGPATFTPVNQ